MCVKKSFCCPTFYPESLRASALVLSVLFHPLLMTTYGCAFLLFGLHDSVYDFLTPAPIKWRITLLVFAVSFILPVLNIYLLYKFERLPSFLFSDRRQRTFPYLLSALFYFGLFYLLLDISIWNSIKLFIAGAGIAILICSLINLRYKISAHMVGLGGLFGMLLSVSYLLKMDITLYFVAVVLLAGLVGASRILLKEHNSGELFSGFVLGWLVQCALFFILRQISFTYIL